MQHYLRMEEVLSPQVIAERERYYLPYLDVKGNALAVSQRRRSRSVCTSLKTSST